MKDLQQPKMFTGLEICRFLCAIAVIVWHYQHFFVVGIWSDSITTTQRANFPLYSLLSPFYQHGHLAVQIFWAVSGFIFFWKYASSIFSGEVACKVFFVLRFSRLYPFHLLTLILVLILQTLYIRSHNTAFIYDRNIFANFLLQLLFASNWLKSQPLTFNGPIWSISVEVLVYLTFFLVVRTLRPNILLCLCVVIFANFLLVFQANPVFQCLAIFFEGGIIFYVLQTIKYKYVPAVLCLSIITIIGLCLRLYFQLPFPGRYESLLAASVVVFFLFAERFIPEALNKIAWLGNLTYSSYLIHFPVQLIMVIVTDQIGIDRKIYLSPISLIVFLSCTFGLAWVAYVYFEMPAQKFIRQSYRKGRETSENSEPAVRP